MLLECNILFLHGVYIYILNIGIEISIENKNIKVNIGKFAFEEQM